MKLPRLLAAAPILVLLALLSVACVDTESPNGWAEPTFDGATVYYPPAKDRLSAVELASGGATRAWTFPNDNLELEKDVELRAIYGEPVKDGDRIYVASFSGGVFALDADTGRPLWPGESGNKGSINGNIVGGVALAGDLLFFATTEGRLYAWNKADGRPAVGWEDPKTFSNGIWASPVVSGETVFVATMDGEVHAFDTASGAERWAEPFEATGAVAALTLLDDTRIFAASLNRHVYVLDAATGATLHDFRADDWVWTEPAFENGVIYFGDFSGKTYALDITQQTQSVKWESEAALGARIKAGPAIVDNVLVVADRDSVVHFIDLTNGTPLNRVPLEGGGTIRANAVANDGMVYIVSTRGRLYRADPVARQVVEVPVGGAG